jgi:drug/metabolite transporter (DMT)-like permease
MAKLLVILIIGLMLEALGVVYLSKGLKQIGEPAKMSVPEIRRLVVRGATNGNILLGVLMETLFFITLLILLKLWDVSLVWPLTSLGFVLTALAAKYIRHEEISTMRWTGVILIVLGAVLVGYSEKLKTLAPGRPASSVSKE